MLLFHQSWWKSHLPVNKLSSGQSHYTPFCGIHSVTPSRDNAATGRSWCHFSELTRQEFRGQKEAGYGDMAWGEEEQELREAAVVVLATSSRTHTQGCRVRGLPRLVLRRAPPDSVVRGAQCGLWDLAVFSHHPIFCPSKLREETNGKRQALVVPRRRVPVAPSPVKGGRAGWCSDGFRHPRASRVPSPDVDMLAAGGVRCLQRDLYHPAAPSGNPSRRGGGMGAFSLSAVPFLHTSHIPPSWDLCGWSAAFEGGHEAAVPILAGRDLDRLTEASWGCKILGLGCLPPSLSLKPFQLPGSRNAGGDMPPAGEHFVSQPVGSGPQVLLHQGVEEMVC